MPFRVIFIQDNNHTKKMGKGGDASATAGQRAVKLVGDKSEKITWAEVKKHVSWLWGIFISTPLSVACRCLASTLITNNLFCLLISPMETSFLKMTDHA